MPSNNFKDLIRSMTMYARFVKKLTADLRDQLDLKPSIKVARAYFEKAIDAKLSTCLATLTVNQDEKKIINATAIATVLDHMQELYMHMKLLWNQRMNYFKYNNQTPVSLLSKSSPAPSIDKFVLWSGVISARESS